MNEWTKVEDEVPPFFMPILACSQSRGILLGQRAYASRDTPMMVVLDEDRKVVTDVTHWMLVPDPPKPEQGCFYVRRDGHGLNLFYQKPGKNGGAATTWYCFRDERAIPLDFVDWLNSLGEL